MKREDCHSINDRLEFCIEQVTKDPFAASFAAPWYIEDVTALTAAVLALQEALAFAESQQNGKPLPTPTEQVH